MKLAAALTCAAACGAATAAAAQATAVPSDRDADRWAVLDAGFARPASGALNSFAPSAASTFAVRSVGDPSAPLFAAPAFSGTRLDQRSLLGRDRYLADEGLVRWRTGETLLATDGNAVDRVRLSVGGVVRSPVGLDSTDEAFDLTYTRGWVSALRGRVDDEIAFDVTPHAGFGVSNAGGSAIAGAMIRFGDIDFEDQVKDRLSAMGVPMVTDGARFGDRGRWYVFAAADGRAVGLNLTRDDNGWSRQGLTQDAAAVIGEAQVGVGWRKGSMQAALGVVQREIKHKPAEGLDEQQVTDQAVAFTLSIKPSKKK